MGSFSDYLENALLDHVFGSGSAHVGAYTVPNKFVALCTEAVVDSDSGSDISEVTHADGYARVAMETWSTASAGATENAEDILFPQATGAWGTIVDFAILDSSVDATGNVLAYGSLTISKSVASGDTPKFATGDLDITLA